MDDCKVVYTLIQTGWDAPMMLEDASRGEYPSVETHEDSHMSEIELDG